MGTKVTRRRVLTAGLAATVLAACGPLIDSGTDAPSPRSVLRPRDISNPVDAVAPTAVKPPLPASVSLDSYFNETRVLDVDVKMDPADWEALRFQTRRFEDVIDQRARGVPFSTPFTWFKAEAFIDGERFGEIGIRKKGFFGSLDTEKPSLKLRLNKYVKGQGLPGGLKRLTLNNNRQDPSMIRTHLAYQVYEKAGLPAPRAGWARVSLNGNDLGLYGNIEQIQHYVVPRAFKKSNGNLYEGTVSDFTADLRGSFEKKTNVKKDDSRDIDAVTGLLEGSGVSKYLGKIVDLDQFLTYWAVEVLIGHYDGYAGNMNNFQIYRTKKGKFSFIPWGPDTAFNRVDNPWDNGADPKSVMGHGAIAARLYQDPHWRSAYFNRLHELLEKVWDETELLASVDRLSSVVAPHVRAEVSTVGHRPGDKGLHKPAPNANPDRTLGRRT